MISLRITGLDEDFTRLGVSFTREEEVPLAQDYLDLILDLLDAPQEVVSASPQGFFCAVSSYPIAEICERLRVLAQMISDESAVHGIEEGEAGEEEK